ncbi:alpha-glucosidase [Henriciella litoralis]|uniref:alpha-glucosidase n=1 Tax=Henriciella litoralis TaxID=568102 RepID=UPI0009FDE10D|nr:alpha-glucosidase [Henriciella litoralis]
MPEDTTQDSPWWKGAVIYQIYPRSFLDTDADGIGDLAGIVKGLDHVAALGVDAVWLSPFFTSPMKDYGYDVADYCDVDPMFGSLADFDRLVARAHTLGLKVIIDQVYSHTSDQHAWFEESRADRTNPKADWYVWADPKPDGSPPNNWQAVFGGSSWEWDARRQQYYLHNFLVSQPDLNLHNLEVQDALLETARFWLDRGVDGFRLDAINFGMHDQQLRDNPPSGIAMENVTRPFDMQDHIYNMSQPGVPAFLSRLRSVLDTYGERFTVAEVVGANSINEMKSFTEGETHLSSAYSFDFLYATTLSPGRIKRSLQEWSGRPGEGWPSWAFSNHDAPRAVSRWADESQRKQAADTLMLLLLSLRGNAFIYQGEELGLPQADVPFEHLKDPEAIANWPRTLGRDGARTPMPWRSGASNSGFSEAVQPWLPVDPRHDLLAVDQQTNVSGSSLSVARALIAIRKSSDALRLGEMEFLDTPDGVVAYKRVHGDAVMICVFNLSERPVSYLPVQAADLEFVVDQTGAAEPGAVIPETLSPWTGYWATLKDHSAG